MTTRSPARTTAPSAAATSLFLALSGVIKRLRRNPLPPHETLHAAFHGATPAPRHLAALAQVAEDERLTIGELADRLSITLATASQVVTDLCDWGLLERTTDEADRRRTFVSVTTEHRDTIRAVLNSRLRPLDRALRRLDAHEQATLLRALAILAEELDAAASTGDTASGGAGKDSR